MNREVAAAVLVLLAAPAIAAHEASYLVRGAAVPVESATEGHVQAVTAVGDGWWRVRVSVPLSPVGSRGTWVDHRAPVRSALVPDGFVLPPALAERLRGESEAFEVASEILAWVAATVVLDPEDLEDQDATSVLARRRGRCSGLANAAAALLITAGFEARTVSGLLVDGTVGVPHRWVECRLPGVGWVGSDPTLGLWLLTPRHIVFAESVTEGPEIVVERVELFDLAQLPQRDGVPWRPNAGAELICRLVDGGGTAMAVLRGPAGETRRALVSPEARFEWLFPGRWRLEVVREGAVLERLVLDLRSGEVRSCTVPAVSPAALEVES